MTPDKRGCSLLVLAGSAFGWLCGPLGTTLAGISPSLQSCRASFTVASLTAVLRGLPTAATHEPGVCGEQRWAGCAQPVSAGAGEPASSFLMSSVSTENMNVFGRAPDIGDTIVLASAPASGPGPPGLFPGSQGALTQPPSWPGRWILGSTWPGPPSPLCSRYLCQRLPRSSDLGE